MSTRDGNSENSKYPYRVKVSNIFSRDTIVSTKNGENIIPHRLTAFIPKHSPTMVEALGGTLFAIGPIYGIIILLFMSPGLMIIFTIIPLLILIALLSIGTMMLCSAIYTTLVGTDRYIVRTEYSEKYKRDTKVTILNQNHINHFNVKGLRTGQFTNDDYNLIKEYYPEKKKEWKQLIIKHGENNSQDSLEHAHNILTLAKEQKDHHKKSLTNSRNIIWEEQSAIAEKTLEAETEITNPNKNNKEQHNG